MDQVVCRARRGRLKDGRLGAERRSDLVSPSTLLVLPIKPHIDPRFVAGRFLQQVEEVLVYGSPFHPNAFVEGVISVPLHTIRMTGGRVIISTFIGTEPNSPSLLVYQ